MKVLVAGGTGFVGQPLVQALLDRGDDVSVMSRKEETVKSAFGDKVKALTYESSVEGFDAVINLAGAGIAEKKWSDERKKVLRDSRLETTTKIAEGIAKAVKDKQPAVFVNASAVGIYGWRGKPELDEEAPVASDFMGELCQQWEQATKPASDAGVRTAMIRIGVVLEAGGGALQKMAPPFKFFAGAPLGDGKQWMSWIHRDDLVRLLLYVLDTEELSGPINGTAPKPETNKDFSKALARAMKRPCLPIGVPAILLKLMLGEMSAVVLQGNRVIPKKATDAGFQFIYRNADQALRAIYRGEKRTVDGAVKSDTKTDEKSDEQKDAA